MPKIARDNTEAAIRSGAVEFGLPAGVAGKLVKGLKPAVRLLASPRTKAAVGGTRAGGRPDLPDGVEWPTTGESGEPMPFVLQVNLTEVAAFDVEGVLPNKGLLSFFFYTEDEDSGEEGCVLFFPEATGVKPRRRWPEGLPAEARYRDVPLVARPEWTLPSRHGLGLEDTEPYFDLLRRVEAAQGIDSRQGDGFQLLGNPQFVQPGELEKDQRLLLQISPDYAGEGDGCTGMAWGDGGSVYYLMKTNDLKASAFDRLEVLLDMA